MKTDVLHLVKPEFHSEFLKFVETGEATKEFCDYLDHDKDCQKAIDIVFREEWNDLYITLEKIKRDRRSRNDPR